MQPIRTLMSCVLTQQHDMSAHGPPSQAICYTKHNTTNKQKHETRAEDEEMNNQFMHSQQRQNMEHKWLIADTKPKPN